MSSSTITHAACLERRRACSNQRAWLDTTWWLYRYGVCSVHLQQSHARANSFKHTSDNQNSNWRDQPIIIPLQFFLKTIRTHRSQLDIGFLRDEPVLYILSSRSDAHSLTWDICWNKMSWWVSKRLWNCMFQSSLCHIGHWIRYEQCNYL